MASSGLAGKVRRCRDSDEFDLGGASMSSCVDLAKEAFSEPFELTSMIKITFVVGAGKLGRQKYGDDLPKNLMHAMDGIGFAQDNAACTELSSGGTYKYQHDTSKNLKFVHVFPKVVAPAKEEGEEGEEGEEEQGGVREPMDVLAECEIADFRRMVGSHVTSYSCKKRVLDGMKERLTKLEEAEQKLIARETLDSAVQKLYDTLSQDGLKDKMKFMAVELQGSIDAGELTSEERPRVLEQLDGKLSDLQTQLTKAEADGKAKMQAKLEEGKEKLKATKAAISDAKPAATVNLKYAAEIQRLHKRIAGLNRLEKESAGKYTLDQLKALGEKPEMEEAVSVLKTRSRMWFESDEEFTVRLKYCLAQAPEPKKKAASGGYPAGNSSGGFTTVKKR